MIEYRAPAAYADQPMLGGRRSWDSRDPRPRPSNISVSVCKVGEFRLGGHASDPAPPTMKDDDDEQRDKVLVDRECQANDKRVQNHAKLEHADRNELGHALGRRVVVRVVSKLVDGEAVERGRGRVWVALLGFCAVCVGMVVRGGGGHGHGRDLAGAWDGCAGRERLEVRVPVLCLGVAVCLCRGIADAASPSASGWLVGPHRPLTVRQSQPRHLAAPDAVRGNLGEEDGVHGHHRDGGCPVLWGACVSKCPTAGPAARSRDRLT